MHFKYSNVINLVFVTFLHGVAFPILFPISLVGILNNFMLERILLAYYYKQPPLFDNRLNDRALGALFYAPFLLLANAYWVLGNRQMFFNEHHPKHHTYGEIQDPNHSPLDFKNGPNHLVPILIWTPLLVSLNYMIKYVTLMFEYLGCMTPLTKLKRFQRQKIHVNDNLGSYWNCLSGID